ncbi:E2F-associated phosphoprotein [Macadamia integrifolia]|uniref:E2F-associated phosphoprotein n=1 Tax=Macadamia integrifolia TaxID=60698 RepID=UPI001C4E5745|nr:E2F-associated phosphoprotein [Macadamia integrifolia]
MEPEKEGKLGGESPTESQQTVSDDDEIDYSIKPEFYDSDLDEKDESWINKKRKGRTSDANLSCPACFTTLCLECQRSCFSVTPSS